MESKVRIEFRVSRRKTLIYIGMCVLFVALGLLMANDPTPTRPDTHFWGWNAVIFSGLGIPILAYRLFRPRPRLVISNMGIEDLTNGLGLIPWLEISAAEFVTINRSSILSLSMHDPEKWIPKLRCGQRLLTPMSRILGGSDINIPISGLTENPTEVYRHVADYLHT